MTNPERIGRSVSLPGDEEAVRRLKIKSAYLGNRRALRYHNPATALPTAARGRLKELGPAVEGVQVLRQMQKSL